MIARWLLAGGGALGVGAIVAAASVDVGERDIAPRELDRVAMLRVERNAELAEDGGVLLRRGRPFTGTVVDRYESGERKRESEYVRGRLHGEVRSWYLDGSPEFVRRYAEGREDGTHEGWYPSGAPRFVYRYAAGLAEGESTEWYESGQMFTSFNHRAGQEAGTQRMWTRDGELRANYVVKDGRRYGLMGSAGCRGDVDDGLPYYRTSALTPEWLAEDEARGAGMHRVGRFSLVNHRGEPVTDSLLDGRVTVVYYFFASCGGTCPLLHNRIARILGGLGADSLLTVLAHSVQPERDNVAALGRFAAAHGVEDSRWHLLTGSRAAIERLARESYFVNLRDGRAYGVDDLAHTETVLLIDGERRIRGVYSGTLALEVEQLARDARRLLDAGRG